MNHSLPLASDCGLFPYAKIIFDKSDKATKANLKLSCKSLWRYHVRRKFLNNYVEEQTGFVPQLYCYADGCRNREAFEECFSPKLLTTNSGEVCGRLSPRSRLGWPIVNVDDSWDRHQPPKKIKEWTGCPECWAKFIRDRPEYDLNQSHIQNDSDDLYQLFMRLIGLKKRSERIPHLRNGINELMKTINNEIKTLLNTKERNSSIELSIISSFQKNESIFHLKSNSEEYPNEDFGDYSPRNSDSDTCSCSDSCECSDSSSSSYLSDSSNTRSESSDLYLSESESD